MDLGHAIPDVRNNENENECRSRRGNKQPKSKVKQHAQWPVPSDQQQEVKKRLAEAWEWLEGCDEQRTEAYKLDRAENLRWQSPTLSFVLERHGATVRGSTRAELHHWEVNLDKRQASIVGHGRRQLRPQAARMDAEAIAAKVAASIISHRKQPWLKWNGAEEVRVVTSRLIPPTNPQTSSGRRKRFRDALLRRLAPEGWTSPRPNFYKKREPA
jgi:hypothetical protein